MNSNFKPEEIVQFERYNKKEKRNVVTEFPVVGGRLRLYHEDLAKQRVSDIASGIEIEIVKYENDVAVIKARVCIGGNAFTGVGMASKSRDSMIYPAILEMAETRAIARALRFAGYGVEYTGAEEMQGLKKFDETSKEPSTEPSTEPSDKETYQTVNDKPTPETGTSDANAPSLKRQVWNLVVELNPGVQENYLAEAMKAFVKDTLDKYDDGDIDNVYAMVMEHQDKFAMAFVKYVKGAVPEIKSPIVDKEYKEAQKELNQNMKVAADKMQVPPPPPVIDPDKVKKANIYREMPDGISVAALNGSLDTLIKENPEHEPGVIYDMVLGDIEGFMVIMASWCKKNEIPTGIETKTTEEKKDVAPVEEQAPVLSTLDFRKLWVRLDWDNFNKFVISNCDTFKANREEYDLAVAKFDRLKAKDDSTKGMKFPYLFSYEDVEFPKPKISTEKSVMDTNQYIPPGPEAKTLSAYMELHPAMVDIISTDLSIDLTSVTEAEAELINEQVELKLTKQEE